MTTKDELDRRQWWWKDAETDKALLELEQWNAGWKERAETAEAALAAAQAPCAWTDNYDGTWSSDCDVTSEFGYQMSPNSHDWKFCPYCGKPIKEVQP